MNDKERMSILLTSFVRIAEQLNIPLNQIKIAAKIISEAIDKTIEERKENEYKN